MKNKEYKISQVIDEIITNYKTGSSEKIDGLLRYPFKVVKMCEYYSSSRYLRVHETGEYNKDALGRDKPFYNIVNYRVTLAKTATDLDIKDIQIISDNPQHQVESMLLNREAYEWMKEDGFSLTLNKMGTTRPKYGGYMIKKTKQDSKLHIDTIDWSKVYTDLADIMGGPILEEHHMSPVALKKKDAVWEDVDTVLKAHKGQKDKNKSNKIKVYEILGELPKCVLKNVDDKDETLKDEYEFSLQKYFVAEVSGKKYPMYWEEPEGKISDYYEYLSWEDQSLDLGRGVIEDSEEAQVWTNDAVINESTAMNLAGRAGIITTSKKLGNNILEHDHGKIYEVEPNADAKPFNIVPGALGEYQNQIDKWKIQADNVTSSFNSITGEQPPSGTPYSTTALLNQVATKPFDYKREEWGIHLSHVFENWVIPFLVDKIKKEHILVSEFSDSELEMIDESFSNFNSNNDIVEEVISGGIVSPLQQQDIISGYKQHIKKQGKKRFIEVPKNYFNDIDRKVTVLTTGEQKNKAVILQSLSEIMNTVIKSFNPQTGQFGVLQDPTLSKIFNQILEISGSGISPVSIGKGGSPTQAPQSATPTPIVPSPIQLGSNPLAKAKATA